MRNMILAATAGILGVVCATGSFADQVINDDLIVSDNLLCVGSDCLNNDIEVPDRDALKIKGFNTAIRFDDTTTVSTRPSRDWQLSANQTTLFSLDAFYLEDISSASVPFLVEGGTRNNALYVANNNHIGMGTSIPEAELHLVNFGDVTLRMESTFSGGGDWIISSEAQSMAFTDADAGTAPVRFFGGAPTSSLVVGVNGAVGMGTLFPNAPLHVRRTLAGSGDMLKLEGNGPVVLRMEDTSASGQEWTFQSNGGLFRVASPAIPGPELTVDDFGNLTIKGEITTAGSCSAGCDRVFDAGYDLPDMTTHHAKMWELGHLPNVGPTAEDGPMNLSQKVGGMLNELEHAHIYIDQLHTRLAHQEAELEALKAMVEQLK